MKTKHYPILRLRNTIIRFKILLAVAVIIVAGTFILFKTVPLSISIKSVDPVLIDAATSKEPIARVANQAVEYGVVPGNVPDIPKGNRAAQFKKIKDAGFTVIRVNFNWSMLEPAQGKYAWEDSDAYLKTVNDAGLRPIIEIDHVPTWNRPAICKTDPHCAPLATDQFGVFAGAAASRYKKYNVVAWEIWNEENSVNFWKPFPNPNQYAHLLASANIAIKKADPNAVVLLGGLSGDSIDGWGSTFVDPRTYLAEVYGANGKDSFDGVAYHPYIKGFGLPSEKSDFNGWAKMATGANNVRSIMVAHGDSSKGVWITEFGITTGGKGTEVSDPSKPAPKGADHVSFEAQAAITKATLADMKQYPWIRSFIWYDYKDDASATTNTEAGYGLWQYNGQPKPALRVLQDTFHK